MYNTFYLFAWSIRNILSCKTIEQINTCDNIIKLFYAATENKTMYLHLIELKEEQLEIIKS